MVILRYPENHLLISSQDPFVDMLNWLGFLCAKDYLVQLLQNAHSLPVRDARDRSLRIIPHVRIAIDYIHQSLDGPWEISFLPTYYAILNLMKVYILLGPRHTELPRHRWHGVSYDVHGKDSQSVLTEVLSLKKDGVFPLFYRSITGKILTPSSTRIQMKDILPFVSGISYEYELAAGTTSLLRRFDVDYVSKGQGLYPLVRVKTLQGDGKFSKAQIKMLRDFHGQRGQPNTFMGKRIGRPHKRGEDTKAQMNTYLIYRNAPDSPLTAICSKRIELPEELPIALMFFYMSSIVRYKPEFFRRLQDSKFWPLLSSARLHSFNEFLLAFWSFMQQKNCFVNPPPM